MVDFSKLLPILSQSKTQTDNPALYQVISSILTGLNDLTKTIAQSSNSDNSSGIIVGPTTTLTDDLIKTWPTIFDLTIVPASNVMVIPDFVVIHADTRRGAYTNLSAAGYIALATAAPPYEISNYIINDGTGFNGTGLHQLLGTGNVAVSVLREETDADPNGWGSIATVQGNDRVFPLYARFSNPAGNLTGGNAQNLLKITPCYIKLPIFP